MTCFKKSPNKVNPMSTDILDNYYKNTSAEKKEAINKMVSKLKKQELRRKGFQ